MQILRQYKESDLLFYDLECVRTAVDFKSLAPDLREAFEYKARHFNEQQRKTGVEVSVEDFFNDKAALYAPFSQIVCIVVGRIDGDKLKTRAFSVRPTGDTEATVLEKFGQLVSTKEENILTGFNTIGFDGPLINKRMIVNRVLIPAALDTADTKPWLLKQVDLSRLWQGNSYYPDSLSAVSAALGIPSPKSNVDGSQVSDLFYKGKYDEIAQYCTGDVLATANIYRVFMQKTLVTLA